MYILVCQLHLSFIHTSVNAFHYIWFHYETENWKLHPQVFNHMSYLLLDISEWDQCYQHKHAQRLMCRICASWLEWTKLYRSGANSKPARVLQLSMQGRCSIQVKVHWLKSVNFDPLCCSLPNRNFGDAPTSLLLSACLLLQASSSWVGEV